MHYASTNHYRAVAATPRTDIGTTEAWVRTADDVINVSEVEFAISMSVSYGKVEHSRAVSYVHTCTGRESAYHATVPI